MILSPFPHRIDRKKSVVFFRAEGARKLAPLKFKVLQSLNKFYETLRTFVRFTRGFGDGLDEYLPTVQHKSFKFKTQRRRLYTLHTFCGKSRAPKESDRPILQDTVIQRFRLFALNVSRRGCF